MTQKPIRVAYSPDSDDLFMFYAIIENKIDTSDYTFEFHTSNTETLNVDAMSSDSVDVTAISLHNYAYISDRYLMLPHGGSVGVNYGPVLITNQDDLSLDDLKDKKIAVPGLTTTAYLVLKMIIPNFNEVIVPISPFYEIFDAIKSGKVDAGLVIHEGRLLYEELGFKKLIDIGEWWNTEMKMPLPLGGNVIRRSLGNDIIKDVSKILQNSIRYALDNKSEVLEYIMTHDDRNIEALKNKKMIDEYLNLYANETTYKYDDDCKTAMQELLDVGYQKGIIPHSTFLQFAP